MSRYDGLIIPHSYSEYINKTDAATLLQALQLSGVMDAAPTANSNHPAKSGGIFAALAEKAGKNFTRLWQGVITDEEPRTLFDAISNYDFLIVQFVTNQEYDFMILPVSQFGTNQNFMRTVMGNNTTTVTLPFAYQSTCIFYFPTTTKVVCKTYFNNINYKLKICNIWGLK